MKKIYKLKKPKGNFMALKMLSLCCLIGSGIFTANYITHKNYLTDHQNMTYAINKAGQKVFFDTNMLINGSNPQKYLDDITVNNSILSNSINYLYENDSSLLSFINKNSLDLNETNKLKSNVAQISQLANDLNYIKDSYVNFNDNKENLNALVGELSVKVNNVQKNDFYNQETKALFAELMTSIQNVNIFDKGNLFYSKEDILKAQVNWFNNLVKISGRLNNSLNVYMGTRVSSELAELNSKTKSLINITNDFIKINQFRQTYNDEKINILNNNFNSNVDNLLNKQKNLINSDNLSLYIAIGLFLLALLSLLINILNKGGSGSSSSKKDKKQLLRYKDSVTNLESLLKNVLTDKDKNISKSAYNSAFLSNTTKDVTTFNLRTTIDKIFSIFFNLIDNNKKSMEFIEENAQKIITKLDDMELKITEMQVINKNRGENAARLLDNQTRSINTVNTILSSSHNALKQSVDAIDVINNITESMHNIRETSQEISKRIKRMSESSQAIGENTDYIREVSKQIEVLALDVGINASSLSSSSEGRRFTITAKEIQRLAKYASINANKIDELMSIIKEDAKMTVYEMEQNTFSIVEADALIDKINKSISIVHSNVDKVREESERLSEVLERNRDDTGSTKELLDAIKDFIQNTSYFIDDVKNQVNIDLRSEMSNSLNEIVQRVNTNNYKD